MTLNSTDLMIGFQSGGSETFAKVSHLLPLPRAHTQEGNAHLYGAAQGQACAHAFIILEWQRRLRRLCSEGWWRSGSLLLAKEVPDRGQQWRNVPAHDVNENLSGDSVVGVNLSWLAMEPPDGLCKMLHRTCGRPRQ
jgi:hypothetical protein